MHHDSSTNAATVAISAAAGLTAASLAPILTHIASLIRHGLTAAGGFLIARGVASTEQITELVGALLSLASVGWSIKSNLKKPADPKQ
jgi:hypothetical protein